MANSLAIVGSSGSGKSTSIGQNPDLGIKGLDPKETFIINVKGKPLPFKGWKSQYTQVGLEGPKVGTNYFVSTDALKIIQVLKYINTNRLDIKNVVLEDSQYVMSQEFMDNALKSGYDKFNRMAKNMYDIIDTGINMRDTINFIVVTHDDEENGISKFKTLGKMLDDKVNLAGLFTVVLYTTSKNIGEGKLAYYFVTNRMVNDRGIELLAKSPVGMFTDKLIPNDMGFVLDKVEEYNK